MDQAHITRDLFKFKPIPVVAMDQAALASCTRRQMARQMTEVVHGAPGDTYWSRSVPVPREVDLAVYPLLGLIQSIVI